MEVSAGHRDRDAPLLPWVARIFEDQGAAVKVGDGDENAVRSLPAGGHEVVVQGLPNLLHEVLHALQAGVIADDHAIDYGLIPFDVRVDAQRRILWEEIACAVVSCSFLADEAAVDPWFADQVEIQGVFYGFADDDLAGLRAFVEATEAAHPGEVEAVIEHAQELLEARLRAVGAPEGIARARRRCTFAGLWRRYRRAWEEGLPR
ncbi:MAG TPA: hypothetical protein PKW35_05980 [Nannocystaceae bacterium]|nr:hypothetical protein [Nannocystaceae bacterium]